jgi:hypothetical protein
MRIGRLCIYDVCRFDAQMLRPAQPRAFSDAQSALQPSELPHQNARRDLSDSLLAL